MICYCAFKGEPDKDSVTEFVGLQDQDGRPTDVAVQASPHPTLPGVWRLGPFYVPDVSLSEFSNGIV